VSLFPIVERELRVSSRRSITYYSRIAAAAIGMTIVFVILRQSGSMPPGTAGKALFTSISSIAMMFCMAGGIRFTADSISEERREGTLGLLFLTDLKGSDVVFGKLAASSLNLVYGVIALSFPFKDLPAGTRALAHHPSPLKGWRPSISRRFIAREPLVLRASQLRCQGFAD